MSRVIKILRCRECNYNYWILESKTEKAFNRCNHPKRKKTVNIEDLDKILPSCPLQTSSNFCKEYMKTKELNKK